MIRVHSQTLIYFDTNYCATDSSVPSINIRRAQSETIFEEPFAPTSPRSGGPPPASSSTSNTGNTTTSSSNPSGQLPPQSPTSLSFLGQDPNPTADFPPNYNLSRRTSVSAESLAPSSGSSTNQTRRTSSGTPKTNQQQQRIRTAISANLLFKNLDDEQTKDVLDAMT